jgi:hypothetical protein
MKSVLQKVGGYLRGVARILLVVGGSIAALVIALVLGFWIVEKYNYYYGFDQKKWLAIGQTLRTKPNEAYLVASARQWMAADVAAHYLTPGMSRQTVTALLGPFDTASVQYDSTLFQLPPVIGYQVWQGDWEKKFLYLEFTSQGKLTKCWEETN